MDHDILHMRLTIWLTIATLCAVIVFAAFPFLDLRISPCSSTGRLVTGWAAARTSCSGEMCCVTAGRCSLSSHSSSSWATS